MISMRNRFWIAAGVFALGLLLSVPSYAQTTTVSATVTDPSGIPYYPASVKAQLVTTAGSPVTGQPTFTVNSQAQCVSGGFGSAPCQVPFQGTVGPTSLNPSGAFTLVLQDNTQVTPASTQWLFTISTLGTPPPLGTGPQSFSVSITISGASQSISLNLSSLAPALGKGITPTGIFALNFGLHDDVQWAWDASYTNGSNDLVLNNTFGTDPPFLPSDVCPGLLALCKQLFCTNLPIIGGAGQQTSTVQLPAPNQMTTISQFISAFHVKTTANASATNAGSGVCAWGTPDDTVGANSPATLAANASLNACVPLVLPAQNKYGTGPGAVFITHDWFNQDTARFCPRSGEGARGGAGIVGAGPASGSYVIIAPTFNTSTCTHGISTHSCILTVFDGQYFQNFVVWGLGESGTTGTPRGVNLVEVGRGGTNGNGTMENVFFMGLWGGDSSVKGLLFNGGGLAFRNVQFDGFGGNPCNLSGIMLAGWDSGYCGDGVNTAISSSGTATFHSMFAGPANPSSNGCVLNINGGVVHDYGGTYSVFSSTPSGQAGACVNSGGTLDAHGTKFDVTGAASSFAVDVLSGGKAYLETVTALAPAAGSDAVLNNAGGTVFDMGGNTFTGTTPYAGAGSLVGTLGPSSFAPCQLGGAAGTTSPAACGQSQTGVIAVPASQTTYTVNTNAVNTTSQIIVQQTTDNTGIATATCNSGATAPIVTSRVAQTSFNISLTSVASVTCFRYMISN